jgi:signal transduction histidine kinase
MTDDTADGRCGPPLRGWPDPVVRYDIEDGTPVVSRVNDAFRATFEQRPLERPLLEGFDALGLTARRPARFAERVDDGAGFTAVLDDATVDSDGTGEAAGAYSVRVLPHREEAAGHVLFVEPTPEVADPPERRDWLVSAVSHDLRNPLDVAKARLRAGRETGDETHFEHVARAHERIERIVRDVLTATRGESAIAVDPTPGVAVGDVAERAWGTVETGRASLRFDGPDPPSVSADEEQLGRVFENLFRNAVEHAEHSPTVTVGGVEEPPEGFYVADDGPGIAPEHRSVVFEPGYSTRDRGTGIGLAIAQRVVAAHGWSIAVEPSADGGARFEIHTRER